MTSYLRAGSLILAFILMSFFQLACQTHKPSAAIFDSDVHIVISGARLPNAASREELRDQLIQQLEELLLTEKIDADATDSQDSQDSHESQESHGLAAAWEFDQRKIKIQLAGLYFDRGGLADLQKAQHLYEGLLGEWKGDRRQIRLNLARIYEIQNDSKKAKDLYLQNLSEMQEQELRKTLQQETLLRLAEVEYLNSDFASAEKYFTKLKSTTDDLQLHSWIDYRLAWCRMNRGDLQSSIKLLQSLVLSDRQNLPFSIWSDLIVFWGKHGISNENIEFIIQHEKSSYMQVQYLQTLAEEATRLGQKPIAFQVWKQTIKTVAGLTAVSIKDDEKEKRLLMAIDAIFKLGSQGADTTAEAWENAWVYELYLNASPLKLQKQRALDFLRQKKRHEALEFFAQIQNTSDLKYENWVLQTSKEFPEDGEMYKAWIKKAILTHIKNLIHSSRMPMLQVTKEGNPIESQKSSPQEKIGLEEALLWLNKYSDLLLSNKESNPSQKSWPPDKIMFEQIVYHKICLRVIFMLGLEKDLSLHYEFLKQNWSQLTEQDRNEIHHLEFLAAVKKLDYQKAWVLGQRLPLDFFQNNSVIKNTQLAWLALSLLQHSAADNRDAIRSSIEEWLQQKQVQKDLSLTLVSASSSSSGSFLQKFKIIFLKDDLQELDWTVLKNSPNQYDPQRIKAWTKSSQQVLLSLKKMLLSAQDFQDIALEALALRRWSEANLIFYEQLKSLPRPLQLSPEQREEYVNLLERQARVYRDRSREAGQLYEELILEEPSLLRLEYPSHVQSRSDQNQDAIKVTF